jgi:hypothetical protein
MYSTFCAEFCMFIDTICQYFNFNQSDSIEDSILSLSAAFIVLYQILNIYIFYELWKFLTYNYDDPDDSFNSLNLRLSVQSEHVTSPK